MMEKPRSGCTLMQNDILSSTWKGRFGDEANKSKPRPFTRSVL